MKELREAQAFVLDNRNYFQKGSLIPSTMSYRSYKSWAYHTLDKFRAENPEYEKYHYHGNRHEFAHLQYEAFWRELTSVSISAPVISSQHGHDHIKEIMGKSGMTWTEARNALDRNLITIAEKLGHHRIDSAFHYVGK